MGHELVRALGQAGHQVLAPSSAACDLSRPACVAQLVAAAPEAIVHAAAYTNVDGCARDPELAHRVNALGTSYVALACRELDVPLAYISTNEVFDGQGRRPYLEYDPTGPINAYGQSKWGGEQAVRSLVPRHYICRVAWLYGGPRSFVRTVLRLAAEHGQLRMVADEEGSPTYAADAADAVAALLAQPYYGTYHIVNEGQASRYAFAEAVLALSGRAVPLTPMALADFVRDSTPPRYTPLRNQAATALGIVLRPWEAALAAYLPLLAAA